MHPDLEAELGPEMTEKVRKAFEYAKDHPAPLLQLKPIRDLVEAVEKGLLDKQAKEEFEKAFEKYGCK